MTSVVSLRRESRVGAIEDQARAWVILLAEDPSAVADCAAWRVLDPAHNQAFEEANKIWRLAPSLDGVIDPDWREEADAVGNSPVARVGHWALRGAGRFIIPLAAAASMVAAIALPQLMGPAPAPVEVQTAIAQTRLIALNDGSRVTLGAHSGVQVRFQENERQVVLESGQAFFEVAHDPARPFIVLAGNAEIRVTGTKFDVRRVGDDVQVSVLEGRVELRRRPQLAVTRELVPARVLTAGERSDMDDGQSFTPEVLAPVTPGEWRNGRLYYSEAPLADIVADLQRYSRTPIRIASADVGALRLTTSFQSNDIDQFIANLETTLPIRSRRSADGTVTISAR